MTRNIILFIGLIFSILQATAQEEGLSIGKKSIDASAILEITSPSNDKGVLLPKLTSFQRESIATPAEGLLVFDTDQDEFYYYDGNQWLSLGHSKYRKGSNAVDEEHLTIKVGNAKNVGITNRLAVGDEDFVQETVAENSVAVQGDASIQGEMLVKNNIMTEGRFEGYGTVPLGGIIMWAGDAASVPDGWILCIGQYITDQESPYHGRNTPNLRGRFIAGYDPSNMFYNEPGDLSDLDAPGNKEGKRGGEEKHILTVNEMPQHDHSLTIAADGNHQHVALIDAGGGGDFGADPGWRKAMWTDRDGASGMSYGNPTANGYLPTSMAGQHAHSGSDIGTAGGGMAHENRPPYYVLAFIMRIR